MDDIRFVQVNHLHPDNDLHVRQFRTRSFDDVPPYVIEEDEEPPGDFAERQAIGDVPPHVLRAFGTIAGSMIHDLYGLRDLFGMPSRIVGTEIWRDGGAISTTLEYPEGLPLRGDMGRSARPVGLLRDARGLWKQQARDRVVPDGLLA